jgi:hypothetical protein
VVEIKLSREKAGKIIPEAQFFDGEPGRMFQGRVREDRDLPEDEPFEDIEAELFKRDVAAEDLLLYLRARART